MSAIRDFWHLCRAPPVPYARHKDSVVTRTPASLERLGSTAALVAWAAVAVPALTGEYLGASAWRWWLAYLTGGALFAVTSAPSMELRPRLTRWLLVPQVVAGVLTFVLAPTYGFAAVLLVINAASAAFRARDGAGTSGRVQPHRRAPPDRPRPA